MTHSVTQPAESKARLETRPGRTLGKIALAGLVLVSVAACRPDYAGPQVAGWTIVDPVQRHPILVSDKPVSMSLRVSRGAYGLSNNQRRRLGGFLHKYRTISSDSSKLVISVPSGSSNEVAAMRATSEIRSLMLEAGFAANDIHVEPYGARGRSAPIRVSYSRLRAEAPECGNWTTNLSMTSKNLAHPDFACNTQKNLAAMVKNPADLLGPRTMTPRDSGRRSEAFNKYRKGEVTGAQRSEDERVKTTEQ